MQTVKKYGARIVAAIGGSVAVIGLAVNSASAQMSTTTLGNHLDQLSTVSESYLGVALDKVWPIVVGFGIIVGIWYLLKRYVFAFR